MNATDEPRRLTGAQALLLAALFAGLSLLFVQLLRPLVAPTVAAEVPTRPAADELSAAPTPTAPEPGFEVATAPLAEPEPPAPPPPYAPEFKGPRIAIVLTDVGDNPTQARAAITELPPNIGLAFTPYPDVQALARAARADGHEIWAGVPMQPKAWPRVKPGANTLLVAAPAAENLRRLDWALARIEGAAGITGIMGSAFTESAAALEPVLGEAGRRGLAYLDARASGRSVGFDVARAAGVRAAVNDRFLDESGSLAANLAELERQARLEGSAIGYARPLPTTVAALKAWAPTLEAKGMLLVPPSSLAE